MFKRLCKTVQKVYNRNPIFLTFKKKNSAPMVEVWGVSLGWGGEWDSEEKLFGEAQ